MKKMSIVFVAALSLAAIGCKKKGGDCAKAIANSMELSKADLGSADDKTKAKMKDLGVSHCKDDKWSDEVVQCMTDAKAEAEAKNCYGKLTPEQQDKMNRSMMEAPPHAGSDMAGSAAAGSAPPSADGSAGSAAPAGSGSGSAAAPK
jgi:hypothetical protein